MDGELWLSMMPGSAKVADLDRDPRIQLHSIISGPEAAIEIKLRGRARPEHDRGVQERYARTVADQLSWEPVGGPAGGPGSPRRPAGGGGWPAPRRCPGYGRPGDGRRWRPGAGSGARPR